LRFSSFGAKDGEKYPKEAKGGRKAAVTLLLLPAPAA